MVEYGSATPDYAAIDVGRYAFRTPIFNAGSALRDLQGSLGVSHSFRSFS